MLTTGAELSPTIAHLLDSLHVSEIVRHPALGRAAVCPARYCATLLAIVRRPMYTAPLKRAPSAINQALGGEAAVDSRGGGELDAVARGDRTLHRALHDHLLRSDVGVDSRGLAERERGVVDVKMSFQCAVEMQILVRAQLALEYKELTDGWP
jgi:hypothetical protein